MTASVLDSITLGYQPFWGPRRTLAGVALFVRTVDAGVDAQHLLDAIQDLLPAEAPPLFLVVQSQRLLIDLLDHARPPLPAGRTPTFSTNGLFAPTIVVMAEALTRPGVADSVRRAYRRGLQLVWKGDAALPPDNTIANCFARHWLTLPPGMAAQALHEALRPPPEPGSGRPLPPGIWPAGHIFGELPNLALADYCLLRCGALAVAGWPAEDTVYNLRHKPLEPEHAVVLATLQALESDRPAEQVDRILCDDPLLAYRFLVYANSPGVGLRGKAESVRHALMMLGTSTLARWLAEQLPHATHDTALRPVKATLVLRGRLMEHLLESGVEGALRREVAMCGLFSGLDHLLDQPLGAILNSLPLSSRLYDAAVLHTGPYAEALQMAMALESADTPATHALGKRHGLAPEDVNRSLLRVVAGLHADALLI